MKNFISRAKKALKNQRGDIVQFVIVLVVIIAIGAVVMPKMSTGIESAGDTALQDVTDMRDKILGD